MSTMEQLKADNEHLKAVIEELILHARRLGEHIRSQSNTLLQTVHHSTEMYSQHAEYITKLEKEALAHVTADEDPTATGV